MKEALDCAKEQERDIKYQPELGACLGDSVEPKDAGRQLYAVIAQLVKGEALDMVQSNENSSGRESWCQLTRRFDPHGAGRRRSIMSQLLKPGALEVKELNAAISRWEKKVRIYGRRSGTPLKDDIEAFTLMEMTKGSLQEHLVLKASKLRSYVAAKEEVQCNLEKRYNEEPSQAHGHHAVACFFMSSLFFCLGRERDNT